MLHRRTPDPTLRLVVLKQQKKQTTFKLLILEYVKYMLHQNILQNQQFPEY